MTPQVVELKNGWTAITVNSEDFRFPNLCPQCLIPNCTWTIQVQSDRGKFAGYFVFFTRWRHTVVKVPFCENCARKIAKRGRFGQVLTFVGLITAVAISVWLDLGRGAVFLLAIVLCLPGILLDVGNGVVHFAVAEEGLVFRFKSKEYAQAFFKTNVLPHTLGVAAR